MMITIEGPPVCQIRMKMSNRGGFTRLYDPRAKQKNDIKQMIFQKFSEKKFEHPIVSFIFHMPIPKSVPKKLLPLYESGLLKHEKKPDGDNFIKLYLDCMDGIVFDGDQKVMIGSVIKLYHKDPKTLLIIHEGASSLCSQEQEFFSSAFLSALKSCECS